MCERHMVQKVSFLGEESSKEILCVVISGVEDREAERKTKNKEQNESSM